MLSKHFSRRHLEIFFIFQENRIWHFMQKETICMKYQILFPRKKWKISSVCCLLNLSIAWLSVNWSWQTSQAFMELETFVSFHHSFQERQLLLPVCFHALQTLSEEDKLASPLLVSPVFYLSSLCSIFCILKCSLVKISGLGTKLLLQFTCL